MNTVTVFSIFYNWCFNKLYEEPNIMLNFQTIKIKTKCN